MKLEHLLKTAGKKKRRVGLGHGSGRSKTSGRGTKGQNARGKVAPFFEGGALPLTKRLPFLKGKGKNKQVNIKPVILKLESLNSLPKNSVVTIESLTEKKLIKKKDAGKFGVKILGSGKLEIPLTVRVPVSKKVSMLIEKAGGQVQKT